MTQQAKIYYGTHTSRHAVSSFYGSCSRWRQSSRITYTSIQKVVN